MAMQEFLASSAVRVAEDGARRLQRILEQNRESASELAQAFAAARKALAGLKAELSDAGGVRVSLSGIRDRLRPESGLSAPGSAGRSGPSDAAGGAVMKVAADLSAADEALGDYRLRAEAMRPELNANASGITSAVASAIAAVRAMMRSVSITIPVRAKATLDTSGLGGGGAGAAGTSGFSGSAMGSSVAGLSGGAGHGVDGLSGNGGHGFGGTAGQAGRGDGGILSGAVSGDSADSRGSQPALAMIAAAGMPEGAIPIRENFQALPLIREMMGELSEGARRALASGHGGGGAAGRPSVAAPVTIHVTAAGSEPAAVGQYIYDTARRSLLKTLEGVFVG